MKRGRAIFRELERKVWSLDRDTEEGQYWFELYAIVKLHTYCGMILKNDMCLFLQESERLGRKIEIVPIKEATDRLDGWFQ